MDASQVVGLCKYTPTSKVIATHIEALDNETLTRMELRHVTNSNQIADDRIIIPQDGEKITLN